MGDKIHHYKIKTVWSGKSIVGNADVKSYDRSHRVLNEGKPSLELTTDNAIIGDKSKLNPEDLLVSSISSCHMLSYLYICSMSNVIILDYFDNAIGFMEENNDGGGKFKSVELHPNIIVKDESMIQKAIDLHHEAHKICYIANSVNFEITIHPVVTVKN